MTADWRYGELLNRGRPRRENRKRWSQPRNPRVFLRRGYRNDDKRKKEPLRNKKFKNQHSDRCR